MVRVYSNCRGCPTAIRILVGDRDETVPSAAYSVYVCNIKIIILVIIIEKDTNHLPSFCPPADDLCYYTLAQILIIIKYIATIKYEECWLPLLSLLCVVVVGFFPTLGIKKNYFCKYIFFFSIVALA